KREFVLNSKSAIPLKDIEQRALTSGETRGFAAALSRKEGTTGKKYSLIAEVKTASPSKGIIRDDVDIEDVAKIYEDNGASCISVLTDEKYFMGSLERLGQIRNTVCIPLLRKDFFIDEYQIFEARHAGADSILLIAACLDDSEIAGFFEIASELKMDCLVEVHDESEMNRIGDLDIGINLVGINNRNLKTFVTDISATGRLADLAPPGVILVSESGINTAEDVKSVCAMGADAVLVGESLMRENDIGKKVRELTNII
ncbi:indole-3-glycerol phosphate synthase TrpC, partial [Candidatus Latescibacterota bacterium]